MRRLGRLTVLLLLTLLLQAPAAETGASDGAIELHRLSERLWVHTSWKVYGGVPTPSNGLLVVTSEGAAMVDTPWTEAQTQELLDMSRERFGVQVRLAVITHAHEDRLGGSAALLAGNVPAFYTERTARLAQKQGYQLLEPRLAPHSAVFRIGGVEMEVYFPGEGHTTDNMTVWFPGERALFAGCLVKSVSSAGIGNVAEANLGEWPNTLDRLLAKYAEAVTVIPGHGEWGGLNLIAHTRGLLSPAVR